MKVALLFVCLTVGLPRPPETVNATVELRALEGYLGLYRKTLLLTPPDRRETIEEMGADLRFRLEELLGRSHLARMTRTEAIGLYHELTRTMAGVESSRGGPGKCFLREMYTSLMDRAREALVDSLPMELEMIQNPRLGFDSREKFDVIKKLLFRLERPAEGLPTGGAQLLREVLHSILADPAWPRLDEGECLPILVGLLLQYPDQDLIRDREAIRNRTAGWTRRLLGREMMEKGELIQGMALIQLYRTLELQGRASRDEEWEEWDQLLPLVPPILGGGGLPGCAGDLRSVNVDEVRVFSRGESVAGRSILPLSKFISPTRYYLVPERFYQVKLVCEPEDAGVDRTFWILTRAGPDYRVVLPRCIPPGMVPITSPETGQITFLADRSPWSIRRFLLAFQRSANLLLSRPGTSLRIYRHTVLREIPLSPRLQPDYATLVGLLKDPAMEKILDGPFWVEAADEAGQGVAFEIASSILNGNTGLRDTSLSLPTAAEANRLWRDGRHFSLEGNSDDREYGLFNATRLIPGPGKAADRPRYLVRTIQRLTSS